MDGTAIDVDWTGTLATGSVVLTDLNTAVAAEGTQEAIDAADYVARIPMSHQVDSLNVAAAAAVAFWQLRKK